jgi:hypothetical protein
MKNETSVFIEISNSGVKSLKILADNAQETSDATAFLAKLSFEIRQLDAAAKEAGSAVAK